MLVGMGWERGQGSSHVSESSGVQGWAVMVLPHMASHSLCSKALGYQQAAWLAFLSNLVSLAGDRTETTAELLGYSPPFGQCFREFHSYSLGYNFFTWI